MSEIKNRHKVMFAALAAAMAVAMAFAVAPAFMTSASAKIQEVDVSCTNGGGQQPGGQQPTCQGGGLTRVRESESSRTSTTRTELTETERELHKLSFPSLLFLFKLEYVYFV